jgi:hypothetical protein
VLPRQLRYGRCQDKLGRGLGSPFVLYHDREFPTTPLSFYARVYVLKKQNFVGDLSVVLSWSRRKSDYERVREYRAGDSEWRGPGRVRDTSFLLLFLLHVIPLLSHIYRSPTSTCAMPRSTSTNDPLTL